MQPLTLLVTVLVILALAVGLTIVITRLDGLAFLAPKSTKRVARSAHMFCVNHCRAPDGTCPLEEVGKRREECALWTFVDADVPTVGYGDPFAHLRGTWRQPGVAPTS